MKITERGRIKTDCISTTHMLGREVLNKPDGFLVATVNDGFREVEYVVTGLKRKKTHANIDDSIMHWSLELRECGNGNVKR